MSELINESTEATATAVAKAPETAKKKAAPGARAPRVAKSEGKPGKKATSAKGAPETAPKATPKPKAAKAPKASAVREGSKTETILGLLKRSGGASLKELMKESGWQAHSVRGFISIVGKKHGLKIESSKSEAGDRVYKIAR